MAVTTRTIKAKQRAAVSAKDLTEHLDLGREEVTALEQKAAAAAAADQAGITAEADALKKAITKADAPESWLDRVRTLLDWAGNMHDGANDLDQAAVLEILNRAAAELVLAGSRNTGDDDAQRAMVDDQVRVLTQTVAQHRRDQGA